MPQRPNRYDLDDAPLMKPTVTSAWIGVSPLTAAPLMVGLPLLEMLKSSRNSLVNSSSMVAASVSMTWVLTPLFTLIYLAGIVLLFGWEQRVERCRVFV